MPGELSVEASGGAKSRRNSRLEKDEDSPVRISSRHTRALGTVLDGGRSALTIVPLAGAGPGGTGPRQEQFRPRPQAQKQQGRPGQGQARRQQRRRPRSSPPMATGRSSARRRRQGRHRRADAAEAVRHGADGAQREERTRSRSPLVIVKGKQNGKDVTMMRVMAPIGVFLPTGVALEVDGGAVGRVPFTRCLPQVCIAFAEAPAPDAREDAQGHGGQFHHL